MSRNRSYKPEGERLKIVLRRLETENRQLRRRLKQALRVEQESSEEEKDASPPPLPEPKIVEGCPKCRSAEYRIIDLGIRTLCICVSCGYRTTES